MARPKKMTTYPKTPQSFDDLRPAEYNPRDITPEAAEGLQHSLLEFGDISGIVWNSRTWNLLCGHRRVEQLRAAGDFRVIYTRRAWGQRIRRRRECRHCGRLMTTYETSAG